MNQLQIDAACNAAWETAIAEAGRGGVPRHIIEAERDCFATGFNMGVRWAMREMLTDAFQEHFAEVISDAISKN